MCTELDQTSWNWFELANATKIDTDAMCQMPMIESSIITTKIPFVLWTNANVILSC